MYQKKKIFYHDTAGKSFEFGVRKVFNKLKKQESRERARN
jgi:hypothetical protein